MPKRSFGWLAVVSVLVVALFADAFLLISARSSSPWASSWNPRVLSIVSFVESHRGLTFKHPVKVAFLSNVAFDKAVSQPQPTSVSGKAQLREALGALRALGLVKGNVNLATSENALDEADVVGEYVSATKTVYVRGSTLTPYVRVTLAHELTHALQDQYFNFAMLQNDEQQGDDSVTALIEGDAVRIQDQYQLSMSAPDQQTYETESNQFDGASGGPANVPAILSDLQAFPYAFGPTYVDSVAASGGVKAIDAAFANPPKTEAQIVDPVDYPAGFRAAPVARPTIPTGGVNVENGGSFGQIALFDVLGSRLGYNAAWSAVQGWEGDNSVTYNQHGRTCVAISVRMQTIGDTTDLLQTAQQWASALPGATVSATGTLVAIRSCDPGSAAAALPTITPSAFEVLSARSAIIDSSMTGGSVDFALGQCVADHVLSGLGTANYSELTADNLSASQDQALSNLGKSSAATCVSSGVR